MSQPTQAPLRSFSLDFNWDRLYRPASPGLFAHADPAEHVRWYEELGCTSIQTFAVSYNGYAWWKGSKKAPVTPGLKHDFLPEITRLAHDRGMQVMGYFCLTANPWWEYTVNPWWEQDANEEVHRDAGYQRLALSDRYLDHFTASIRDALRDTDIDGFMIDWFKPPQRTRFLKTEQERFRSIFGMTAPADGTLPPSDLLLAYDRQLMELAWNRVTEAVRSVRPALIWTNHPFERANDPLWTGHRLLREVDWVLNESPDTAFLAWLSAQVGPHTRILQNLCGWPTHDANAWRQIDLDRFSLYGYARAHPGSTLIDLETDNPWGAANARNLPIIRQAFHELAAKPRQAQAV